MEYRDRTLTCVECGSPFLFSADDQRYHAEKGYTEPKRCPQCRANRRQSRGSMGGGSGGFGGEQRGPRQTFKAVCADCGQETEVPFLPRGDRPVYCAADFARRKRTMGPGSGTRV